MRALVTVLEADGRRGKRLVDDWPEYTDALKGNEIKTRTIYSGITNGTERNNMLGGNYSRPGSRVAVQRGLPERRRGDRLGTRGCRPKPWRPGVHRRA